MKRMSILGATAGMLLAVGGGTAMAAGQEVCVGRPGTPITTPKAGGGCHADQTLRVLLSRSEASGLETRVADLESENAALERDVADLQGTLRGVSRTENGPGGRPALVFSGENVQIVNGDGATDTANGLGNLFIGYDEQEEGTPPPQTGSHNLVLGRFQSFTSYGALIAGQSNWVTGPFSSVLGGVGNYADGTFDSVLGGGSNIAGGTGSAIVGGFSNRASGDWASVSGGSANTATGDDSSILGGHANTVGGTFGTSP